MSNSYSGYEVAIIGMSGRFSGTNDLEDFWENLKSGTEMLTEFSDEYLMNMGMDPDVVSNPNFVKVSGLLNDKDKFDASFFGYSNHEARMMAPSMRIMHEVVWEGLEDAGCVLDEYPGKIGLYLASSSSAYWESLMSFSTEQQYFAGLTASTFTVKDQTAARISYNLNLRGPSFVLDTACSSSLVAVHLASQAILAGECDISVAGGVYISLNRDIGYMHQEGDIYSPDGHCRAFDATAAGTAKGEGVGVVILKSLEQAIADGDNIYAVIRGTAINNDGRMKVGYTSSSISGQADVIQNALLASDIQDAAEITYVETHGTGTNMGDPVEIHALSKAFSTNKKQFCRIGSVKSNIGHTIHAAGIAGLIKTALCLKHKLIPPTINYSRPNPNIDFANTPFIVNDTLTEWKGNSSPLRAGVSSFGIGGTNAHAILEEAPYNHSIKDNKSNMASRLFVLSAKTEEALTGQIEKLGSYIIKNPEIQLENAAYTSQVGRKAFDYRSFFIAESTEQLINQLQTLPFDKSKVSRGFKPNCVFLFPGQGSQYTDMGLGLYQKWGHFRTIMDECFQIYFDITGVDIKQIIYPDSGKPDNRIHQTRYTQPSIFILEYSMARFLGELGVQPDIMIGHSLGEYACACISGVISLHDAISLIVSRAEIISSIKHGSMLSVHLDSESVKEFMSHDICLASINTPMNCVLAGPTYEIDKLRVVLDGRGIRNQIVKTSHAFHSSMMDEAQDTFKARVDKIAFNPPTIPYISTLTGNFIQGDEIQDPDYWWRHMRHTVMFSDGLKRIFEQDAPSNLFIEVGPGMTLNSFVKQQSAVVQSQANRTIQVLRHAMEKSSDERVFLKSIGQLWQNGIDINWEALYDEAMFKIPLPTYAFQKQHFELKNKDIEIAVERVMSELQNKKNKKKGDLSDWFYVPVWRQKPIFNRSNVHKTVEPKTILFFDGSDRLSAAIATRMRDTHNVISVFQQDKFEKIGKQQYSIKAENNKHYNMMIESLSDDGFAVDMVINMWTVSPDAYSEQIPTVDQIFDAQYNSFYNLLYVVKSIKKVFGSCAIQLINVSVDLENIIGNENIQIQSAPTLSALKTLGQEFPAIRVKNIDISSTHNLILLCEQLFTEITVETDNIDTAYRQKKRYVKEYEQLSLDKPLQSRIKTNGTYIITGGLGSIGMQITRHFVEKYNATVILTTRKKACEFPIGNDLLNTKNVHIESVDITNLDELSQSVERMESKFGSINGVIHAAGKTNDFLFIDSEDSDSEYYSGFFRPKVTGLLNLYRIFTDKQLDFFMTMSSLSVVAGGITYCAYSAANGFMDYFMQKLSRPNWISVDWSAWVDSPSVEEKSNLGRDMLDAAVRTEEGMELLERILAMSELSHIIQFAGDLNELTEQWLQMKDKSALEPVQPFIMSSDRETGKKEVEIRILHIWEELLPAEGIGPDTSFFDLGGDSLKALSVVDMINRSFQIEMSLSDFFNAQTASKLSDFISGLMQQKVINTTITKASKQIYYDVTPSQKRMYIINQNDPNGVVYNQPLVLLLKGDIKFDKLEKVFVQLIDRHESLRSVFNMIDGNVKQSVLEEYNFRLSSYEVDSENIQDELAKLIQPFDLNQPLLIRGALLKTQQKEYYLFVDLPHIITDLVTSHIIMKDLLNLYLDEPLEPVVIQFKDFAAMSASNTNVVKMERQRKYWLEKLKGPLPILELPTDNSRPLQRSFNGEVAYYSFGMNESQNIRQYIKKQNITLFSLLLAAYGVMLSKVCNTNDLIIGMPVNGRNNRQLANTVGLFINTLPIRLFPESTKSVREFVQEVQKDLFSALDNQEYPFDELVDALRLERDLSRNLVFDTMFNMLSSDFTNESDALMTDNNLEIRHHQFHQQTSMFDMSFIVENKETINLRIEYSTDLFKQNTIKRLYECYSNVITNILDNDSVSIGDMTIITEEDRRVVCEQFNTIPQEQEGSITSIFHKTAQLFSNVPAVIAEGQQLSYRQLDDQSNALASYLIGIGLGVGSFVPIFVDRSVNTIVSILAVIKAGAAYLPINPEHPRKRIQSIIDHCEAKIAINPNTNFKEQFEIPIIDPRPGWYPLPNLISFPEINANHLAYVIFTSGTTGEPKGIVVTHKNVLNLVHGIKSKILFDTDDIQNVALMASYEFDASVQQIFTSLLSGHTLYVVSNYAKVNGSELVEFYNSNQIHVSDATPVHIRLLIQSNQMELPFLRRIIVGGEALTEALVKRFYRHFEHQEVKLVNVYGPTECCVNASYYPVEREREHNWSVIPLGNPMPNQTIYVMDSNLNLQPIGVIGEIYIGGENVSNGYLNMPLLTKTHFIDNPFHSGKLYKTGDYGKWDTEGNLHYVGRIDRQIKKNGYRIELSDIDSAMLAHRLIDGAASVIKSNRTIEIWAYYTSAHEIDGDDLRPYLADQLPYYMIPDRFIRIYDFPVTSNGKLDYKALPDSNDEGQTEEIEETLIHSNESILLQLWKEVLGTDAIDRNTGFFQIGGNSIKMIQIISGLLNHGLKITMRDFYLNSTIKNLAPQLTSINNYEVKPAEGEIRLTPIQSRFFTFHLEERSHFNQSVLLQVNKNVDAEVIRYILPILLQQHDTLRITFEQGLNNVMKSKYNSTSSNDTLLNYFVEQEQNMDVEIIKITKEVQEKVQLGADQLYAMAYITAPSEDFLFVSIHHLLIDTVSWYFFLRDMDTLLSLYMLNKPLLLEKKSHTYQQWADLLHEYARSDSFSDEKKYWADLAEKVTLNNSTMPLMQVCEEDLKSESFSLSVNQTNALLVDVNESFHTTIEEVLLSAWAFTLNDVFDRQQYYISLESHGRQDLFNRYDFTKTMGWFTAIFPFELKVAKSGNISDQILMMKDNLRRVPNKGIGYGIYAYLLDETQGEKLIEPDILFQYLGEIDGKSESFSHFKLSDLRAYYDRSLKTIAEYNMLVTIFIKNGILRINVSYNNNVFNSDKMGILVDIFHDQISKIIAYCCAKKEMGNNYTDFDLQDLPYDLIDDMIRKIEIE